MINDPFPYPFFSFSFDQFASTFAVLDKKLPYYQAITAVLLAAFLLQAFSRNLIIIDYYTNMRQYAIHCVNTSRPMMHCNGKCQMMKKIGQEEKKDQENPERKMDNKFESVPFQREEYIITALSIPAHRQYFSFQQNIPSAPHISIFHPPQA